MKPYPSITACANGKEKFGLYARTMEEKALVCITRQNELNYSLYEKSLNYVRKATNYLMR